MFLRNVYVCSTLIVIMDKVKFDELIHICIWQQSNELFLLDNDPYLHACVRFNLYNIIILLITLVLYCRRHILHMYYYYHEGMLLRSQE